MLVCSCGSATTLDSQHESLNRFVQQSRQRPKTNKEKELDLNTQLEKQTFAAICMSDRSADKRCRSRVVTSIIHLCPLLEIVLA
jgi:hypothetical protein